jgi:hypothetical protein
MPGYHYEASPEQHGLRWRLASGRKCRAGAGGGHNACGRPCVAELRRAAIRVAWWAYCEQHLYGRWIEDGQVMHWQLAEDGSDA